MAYRYTLLVDSIARFSGTSLDAERPADDVYARASEFAPLAISRSELAADIDRGFTTIDLRLNSPAITVRVCAA